MLVRPDVLAAIFACGVASYACRFLGFFLMRYVKITPPVAAWLHAIPLALIGAILGPIAVNGGPPEWTGLAAAILLMRVTGNQFVAAIGGVTAVAAMRALAL
ncbi:branched-chain amino acid transport protein AzlD [Variibacter gotjawalensis]|uniref:Branched-chain amino acid transport protein AzlD n=1 Tax=Variibacter gotjawalensis TaxID=1333996 RepID=A0A0S3PQR1_9BRAD|nr:AzlD domain-containing protein [Variibacter gotjawalensis]NIK48550.1 putative membrane protein [Variibacter gotjawalensis]RZS50415.1 putative membrane protein [Variibacter gotjawalensis]BAT58249.1 branched-chain amino acid transport protein AzlD [Variibacter gotjawalensis]